MLSGVRSGVRPTLGHKGPIHSGPEQQQMSYLIRSMVAIPLVAFFVACGSDSPAGPSEPTTGSLKVVNSSSNSVMFIRTRVCGSTGSWGSDILGADILWQEESITRSLQPGCIDVRFTPSEVGADYLYVDGVVIEAGKTKTVTLTVFPAE